MQFKNQVVTACSQVGASVAGIALEHGLNANMVRKWIRELSAVNHALDTQGFVALPMPGTKVRQQITDKGDVSTGSFCIEIPYRHQPIRIHWQSAKLNGHDPYAYLKDVLTRLPTHKASAVNELLPHNWRPETAGKV